MNIVVQGTKEFSDYTVFLRAMGVALSDMKDDRLNIYSVGPSTVNSFTAEFSNRSENSLRQRGIKTKFYKVPYSFVEENMRDFDYFAFLSAPNQKMSRLASLAEKQGIELGLFRY